MSGEHLQSAWEPSVGAQLTERIRYWDTVFLQADAKDYEMLCAKAIPELDSLWMAQGLLGEECLVSGFGIWSELAVPDGDSADEADENQGDTLNPDHKAAPEVRQRQDYVSAKQALSHGFVVCRLTDEMAPSIWCKFELPSVRIEINSTLANYLEMFMLVKPDGMSVVALSEFEDPFEKVVTEATAAAVAYDTQLETLSEFSYDLVKLVRSTSFRRLKRREQARQVDQLIEHAEAATGILNAGVLLEPEYGYVTEITSEGVDYRPVGLHGLCLNGICLGLTMLGREQLSKKAIRRDTDLFSKYDGLALSISIEDEQELPEYTGLARGGVVHIPISGQSFFAVIESDKRLQEVSADTQIAE